MPRGVAAALMISLTASAAGYNACSPVSGTACTLLLVHDEERTMAKAALIPGAYTNYDTAVRFWIGAGTNLLLPGMLPEPWPDRIKHFIERRTFFSWHRDTTSRGLQWAYAAWSAGRPPENQSEATLNLISALMQLMANESFHSDHAWAVIRDIWFEADQLPPHVERIGAKCLLRRTPLLVPIDVFRNRGEVAPLPALCWYMVEDPMGPKLSHEETARLLGITARQEVGTHIKRVRKKTSGRGLASVRPDPTLPPAAPDAMLQFDFTLRGEPKKIPREGRR